MKIYKEIEYKNPFYITVLDNGVQLFVYDGYAEGSDNHIYHCIIEEISDDDIDIIGWVKTEAKKK